MSESYKEGCSQLNYLEARKKEGILLINGVYRQVSKFFQSIIVAPCQAAKHPISAPYSIKPPISAP